MNPLTFEIKNSSGKATLSFKKCNFSTYKLNIGNNLDSIYTDKNTIKEICNTILSTVHVSNDPIWDYWIENFKGV